jgi:hypothetical protein
VTAADLVGSWRLLSCEHAPVAGGAVEHPFGPEPQGRLLYAADGRMSVLLVDPRRKRFESYQLFESSDVELAEAARGCVAYSGRWELIGGKVLHRVDVSLFPNWMGGALTRFAALSDKRLTLSTAEFAIRGAAYTASLVWERES